MWNWKPWELRAQPGRQNGTFGPKTAQRDISLVFHKISKTSLGCNIPCRRKFSVRKYQLEFDFLHVGSTLRLMALIMAAFCNLQSQSTRAKRQKQIVEIDGQLSGEEKRKRKGGRKDGILRQIAPSLDQHWFHSSAHSCLC